MISRWYILRLIDQIKTIEQTFGVTALASPFHKFDDYQIKLRVQKKKERWTKVSTWIITNF